MDEVRHASLLVLTPGMHGTKKLQLKALNSGSSGKVE